MWEQFVKPRDGMRFNAQERVMEPSERVHLRQLTGGNKTAQDRCPSRYWLLSFTPLPCFRSATLVVFIGCLPLGSRFRWSGCPLKVCGRPGIELYAYDIIRPRTYTRPARDRVGSKSI